MCHFSLSMMSLSVLSYAYLTGVKQTTSHFVFKWGLHTWFLVDSIEWWVFRPAVLPTQSGLHIEFYALAGGLQSRWAVFSCIEGWYPHTWKCSISCRFVGLFSLLDWYKVASFLASRSALKKFILPQLALLISLKVTDQKSTWISSVWPKPFLHHGPKQTKMVTNHASQGPHTPFCYRLPTVITLGLPIVPSRPWQAHHEVRQRLGVVAFRLEGPLLGLDSEYFWSIWASKPFLLALGGFHECIWLCITIFVHDWTYRWPDFIYVNFENLTRSM